MVSRQRYQNIADEDMTRRQNEREEGKKKGGQRDK
jgi:hypothetical protein